MVQKIFLPLHDRLNYLVDGLPPVFDVSQEVDCRPHLLSDKTLRLVADALAEHLLILLADSQSRTTIVGEVDHVLVVAFIEFFDVDLGTNEDWFFRRVTATRIRIESTNKLQLFE